MVPFILFELLFLAVNTGEGRYLEKDWIEFV
jgi:hypothetical protein